MNIFKYLKREFGFSLVEILIALGVMSMVALGISSFMGNMNKESRALTEKLTSLTVQTELSQVISSSNLCTLLIQQLGNPQFDSSQLAQAAVNINELKLPGTNVSIARVGNVANPISPSLVVEKIEIRNFTSTGVADLFSARLVVSYDREKTVRAVVPTSIGLMLKTTGAGALKTISECANNSSAGMVNFQDCHSIDYYVPQGTTQTRACNVGYKLIFASALRDGSQDPVTSAHYSVIGDSIMIRADDDSWRMLGKCCKGN